MPGEAVAVLSPLLKGLTAEAKLELLEMIQEPDNVSKAGQQAIDWLGRHFRLHRIVLAVTDAAKTALVSLTGWGLPAAAEPLNVNLDDRRHPLVGVLSQRKPAIIRARPGAAGPKDLFDLLGDEPFAAVPLATGKGDQLPLGLLLLSPGTLPLPPDLQWFADVLSRKLEQLVLRGSLAEDEARFRRERTLLHTVFNAVTDPILLTDTEGRLIIANANAENLFAVSEDMSEGRRRAVELNNMFFSAALSSSAVEDVESARRELLLVDPTDGSDLLVELLSTIVDDPREGTRFVSILRNVTDLRRATQQIEENYAKMRLAEIEARAERDRLDLIIDSVADPILVTDAEGNISMMNAPAERLFTAGAETDEIAQRTVRANDAHFSSFIAGLLSIGPEMRRRGEIGLVDPVGGQGVPVEAISGKVLSELGELTAVVTILHDRTEEIERAQLYEQLKRFSSELEGKVQSATAELAEQNELLRRQALELEQASAAKSQFLAKMSHELQTPLNAVLGYAHILLEGIAGDLTAAQRKNLLRVDANSRHLLAVINEILDITRIEAGQMPVQVSDFAVADLLKEVITELEPIIQRSRLQVTSSLGHKLPKLGSDRQKVKQVLVNLLSNALKFTHEGSIRMRADFRRGFFHLSVSDTGIGIAELDRDRIFEDFQQVDSTTTRAYGGTGLGLSICRRLVTMLRGRIELESEFGKGSSFTVVLPKRLRK